MEPIEWREANAEATREKWKKEEEEAKKKEETEPEGEDR